MAWIDLNADVGETDTPDPEELAVLEWVTSANVACGFHAGGGATMEATVAAAVARRVAVGAHVSFRDREGFGRRRIDVAPGQLFVDVLDQLAALAPAARAAGTSIGHVKAHGALYHAMGEDEQVAGAVVDAVGAGAASFGVTPVLVVEAGGRAAAFARDRGLTVVEEAFCDRAYRPGGGLVDRAVAGAVVTDPAEVAGRAVSLATRGGLAAVDGSWVDVSAATVCLHADTPGAAGLARRVREALSAAGVEVRAPGAPSATEGAAG